VSEEEAMKRLSVGIPESLHGRIEAYCAANGLIMADEILSILEERFPDS